MTAPTIYREQWQALGELLVNYSARVRPGERVMIAMGEIEAYPLVEAVYAASVRAGALPQAQFLSESLRHSILRDGSLEQCAWVPEIEACGMEWADVYFGLRGAYDLDIHKDIPADRLAASQTAMGKISTLRWEKTRWCLVRVPNAEFARQAGTDERTILDMFFAACLLDWEKESALWRRWAETLTGSRNVRILGRNTDLRFSIEGRRWMVGDGRFNMPDGEIATAPVEETIDGHIFFEFPGVLGGRLVEGIFLRWEKGRLAEARASSNEDFLQSVVGRDAGASLVGEFGIGTNPHVDRFCKDILIDEKIGGTAHIALGRAYPECGGTNMSAIHWDIIKDIRADGQVLVDGRPILVNGEFRL